MVFATIAVAAGAPGCLRCSDDGVDGAQGGSPAQTATAVDGGAGYGMAGRAANPTAGSCAQEMAGTAGNSWNQGGANAASASINVSGGGAGGEGLGVAGASSWPSQGIAGAAQICEIGAQTFSSGAANPSKPCEFCRPEVSATTWAVRADGAACDTTKVCHSGVCEEGCMIGSVFYTSGSINPNGPCQGCVPSQSTSRWTSLMSPCVEAVAAGDEHTCAVVNGAAWCWGRNESGQLGNGTVGTPSYEPVRVQGLSSGVEAIAAGAAHTCAIVRGGAQCWGSNLYHTLGNATATDQSSVPIAVAGLATGVQTIAAATYHTCAVASGTVQCWGCNFSGVLGNASMTPQVYPVQVSLPTRGAQTLTAAVFHTCAVLDGEAWCWGSNGDGQLGNSTKIDSYSPLRVVGLGVGVRAIAASPTNTCALLDGAISCWGGGGDLVPRRLAVVTSGVQAVALGFAHGCIVVNGAAVCMGNNGYGQLGDGSCTARAGAIQVKGLPPAVQAITAGIYHTCALVDGSVRCWGDNRSGQLGIGPTAYSWVPAAAVRFQ